MSEASKQAQTTSMKVKEISSPVLKDRFSRLPKSIQDQMALKAAMEGYGEALDIKLGDPRYSGMMKMEYKVKSFNGCDSVVHYIRDPISGQLMNFKFKKHSID